MKLLSSMLMLSTVPFIFLGTALPGLANPAPMQIAYGEYATLTSRDRNAPINIRDGAGTNTYARHIGYAGDRVEILDRLVGNDGYMWYQVRFTVSNATGWVRGDYLFLDEEF